MTENGRHRVAPADGPEDGRVRSVTVDGRGVAPASCGARLGALDNRCPHQGGPLGEGSIEKGLLRCPWHGYDPISGQARGELTYVGIRHEGAAACAYGNLTGRPAECVAIAGPGRRTCLPGSTTWPSRPPPSTAEATTPSRPRSPSGTRLTAAAWRTWCCPMKSS